MLNAASFPRTLPTCRPEELEIEPLTLGLVDDMLYLLPQNVKVKNHMFKVFFKVVMWWMFLN